MEFIEVQSNNVKTTLIKTPKFKTISIQVVFLGEFSKENATKRSLLCRVLSTSTKLYPTKKAIVNTLNDLYDANIGISTYPTYKTSVTSFSLEYVNPKFLENSPNLHRVAISVLKEFIFNPNVKNDAFDVKNFREQKRILKQNIQNVYNNKNRYALRQLLNNMGKDEILSVSALGNLNDLELIDEKNLYDLYLDMIKNEEVQIYVVGDFETSEMLENLKILGDFNNNKLNLEVASEEEFNIQKVNEVVEKQNINQAKLMMGFRTSVNSVHELYIASILFNAMFGGTFASDLIRVVREENSLAYTIASQMIHDLKLLIVSAGIDAKNYAMTTDLVVKELENYKQGRFKEASLQLAKENIINEYVEIEDSPFTFINFYLRNKLFNINYTVDEFIERTKNVTLDQIQKVAQGINLDTIFLLASEDYNG